MAQEPTQPSRANDAQPVEPAATVLPYQTPDAYQTQEALRWQASQGVWNYRGILMMRRTAQLPRCCVKCGAAAEDPPLRRTLRWIERSGSNIPFVGPLVWLLIVLVSAERATIQVWLCEKHWEWRRTHLLGAGIVFIGGAAGFVAAWLLRKDPAGAALAFVGVLLTVASIIYASFAMRTVSALKIDEDFIWLAGVDARFVAQFPRAPKG